MRVNLYGIYKLLGYVDVEATSFDHCPLYIEYKKMLFVLAFPNPLTNFGSEQGYYLVPLIEKIKKGKLYD
jgi:hypothetical protein